jgi:hypothetical protein
LNQEEIGFRQMTFLRKLRSALFGLWKVLSRFWSAGRSIILIFLIVFFIASHLFTGLATLTASVLGTIFGTTTALVNAHSMAQDSAQKLNAREVELEKTRAEAAATQRKIKNLEAKSAAQTRELQVLKTQNSELKREQYVDFKGKRIRLDDAVKTTSRSVQSRTKRVAAANVASAAGESIPFWGIAIIAGATTYELKGACDTMSDIYDLQIAIDPSQVSDEDKKYVCGLKVPTKEELWGVVKASPGVAWKSAVSVYEDGEKWVGDLEPPDFSGTWSTTVSWFGGWFE